MTTKHTKGNPEQELLDVLSHLSDSVSFCAAGTTDLVLPGLKVEGVGDVGIPISAKDARRMIKQARLAPYGRGEETLVDTKVRKVWQLEPSQFRLKNRQWNRLLDEVLQAVRTEFGIKQKVVADLYKMLIYEKGSFFIPHRDTEKQAGMFATLIICLPSEHEGGTLVITHAGQCREFDFGGDASKFSLQYAAFYADCRHEVRPVTKGYRIGLVYNLAIARRKQQPAAPVLNDAIDRAAGAISALFDDEDRRVEEELDGDRPRSLMAIPFLHQYTEAGFALDESKLDGGDWGNDDWDDDDWDEEDEWDEDESESTSHEKKVSPATSRPEAARAEQAHDPGVSPGQGLRLPPLKGDDRARAELLKQAAEKANCRVFVALLTHWQSGYPEYDSLECVPYGSGWGRSSGGGDISESNPNAEFEEVFEEELKLSHWFDLAGRRQPFESLSIPESDILSDVPSENRPFHQRIEEATGNAGMSMERWYQQAVVVLWPEGRHFQVLAEQGPGNSVPALCELVAEADDPKRCEDCRKFARQIIDHWEHRSFRTPSKATLASRFAFALISIEDTRLAAEFVKSVLPHEYAGLDGEVLTKLINQAGWKQLETPLRAFFKSHKPDDYGSDLAALASLFGSICGAGSKPTAERKRVCASLAGEFEKTISRWDRNRSESWRPDTRKGVVEPVVRGMCACNARDPLKRFLDRVTTDAKRYGLHQVIIPAVRGLLDDKTFSGPTAPALARDTTKQLVAFCTGELKHRTGTKPEPPADWARSAKLDCNCDDCRMLAVFLKDKDERILRLPRRKDLRQHLHRQIDTHRIDLTHVTERYGRPYTLVCTKNQASYERALAQYTKEETLLRQFLSRDRVNRDGLR